MTKYGKIIDKKAKVYAWSENFAPNAKNVSRCSNGIAVMTTKTFVVINRICSHNYYRTTDTRYQIGTDKNSYHSFAISLAWWVRLRLDCHAYARNDN